MISSLKIRKRDLPYYALFCMSLINSIQTVGGSSVVSQLLYLSFFASFVFSVSSVSRKAFRSIFLILFYVACVIAFVTNGFSTLSLMVTLAVIILCYPLETEKMIKSITWPRLLSFIAVILLMMLGILPNKIIYRSQAIAGYQANRYSLGFPHPNVVFWFIFPVYTGYLYLRKNKIRLTECVAHIVVCYVFFKLTDCRTGFYVVLILIGLMILLNYAPKLSSSLLRLRILKYAYFIGCLISIFVPMVLKQINPTIFLMLDSLTSYRFSLAASSITEYGISLFGNKIDYAMCVDNSYVYMFESFGIIFTIMFCLAMYLVIGRMQKRNNLRCVVVLIVFSLYFMFEKVYLNVMNNFSLLFISSIIPSLGQKRMDKDNQ